MRDDLRSQIWAALDRGWHEVTSAPGLEEPASQTRNPLALVDEARRLSSYSVPIDGELVHPLRPADVVGADLRRMHDELRQTVLGEGYPCLGARSAFNSAQYRLGLYPELGSRRAALALCHDLYEFSQEFPSVGNGFVTFMAGFREPAIESELRYEQLLWRQLGLVNQIDRRHFSWDPTVSSDPVDPRFSFSIGARAYFVVGLHPKASRRARTVPVPTMVFNLHEQFEHLRDRGRFGTMRRAIRARDAAYHGSVNPVLQDHGERSEARQYSGRAVPDDWVCPFSSLEGSS